MSTTVSVDLGGTWLRIRRGDGIERLPSPSAIRQPGTSADDLLRQLVDTLDLHVPQGAAANISCGAALDEQNGVALGSGPLWGGAPTGEIPLLHILSSRRPDVRWRLVNDVTAGLASFALGFARPTDRHVAYLTISSGIASRTALLTERTIPVDHRGLQGEVGHLRASTSAPEAVRTLPCACGGIGHVSSISSGPAVQAVADVLDIRYDVDTFASSLAAGDRDSSRLLRTVVEPIAELIRTMITLDPRLDRIGIGGGVAEGLWEFYERELTGQLAETRSYADSLTPERVADIIHLCRPGDIDTLAGADAIADGFLRVTKL
ncbi:MAG: ROK family protein [Rhodococcus sp. (in: high G+C Gram-positive bacteria)]|uniref:ROK family protein n=1 Tax=unclassified Rhodococcus (in: high G+C Gram-positive bacteria) TaxID=192944 RepID=UPI000AC293F0|nr:MULTISPECIES: ROK family protein [unclassified Rhodococcus (in: high G+C Gram-positive bacteria)]RMB71794.1 ROK family protein [Rhodococcus sp. SBT000017]